MTPISTLSIKTARIPNHELVGAALAVRANTELIQATSEEIDKRSAEILDLIQNHLIPTLNSQMDALRQLLELEIELNRQCTLIQGQEQQLWDSWLTERDILSKKSEMFYQTQIAPLQDRYQTLRKQYHDFQGKKYKLEAYFYNCLVLQDASDICWAVRRAKEKTVAAKGDITPHENFKKRYIYIFQRHWQE